MADNGANGETAQAQLPVDQLVLNRDRVTGAVSIGGNVADLDLILDMLGRATRHFDVQYRIMAAIQAQEEVKQRQADMMRVQNLLRK